MNTKHTPAEAIANLEAQCAANASLIAAAPDLLAALEAAEIALVHCADFVPTRKLPDSALAVVRAALARAKGESA